MSGGILNRLIDTEAASALLGCSPAALSKFRTERRGPPYIRVGRLIRYRRLDLVRWVKLQRVSPEQSAKPERGIRASGRA
jgi:hypothetical protein